MATVPREALPWEVPAPRSRMAPWEEAQRPRASGAFSRRAAWDAPDEESSHQLPQTAASSSSEAQSRPVIGPSSTRTDFTGARVRRPVLVPGLVADEVAVARVIEEGDVAALKALLRVRTDLANAPLPSGRRPLHEAIEVLNADSVDSTIVCSIVSTLLSFGADASFKVPPLGETLLHVLLRKEERRDHRCSFPPGPSLPFECTPRLALVVWLLRGGADPNLSDDYQEGPLHEAAVSGDSRACWLLLSYRALPENRNTNGQRPLDLSDDCLCCDILERAMHAPADAFSAETRKLFARVSFRQPESDQGLQKTREPLELNSSLPSKSSHQPVIWASARKQGVADSQELDGEEASESMSVQSASQTFATMLQAPAPRRKWPRAAGARHRLAGAARTLPSAGVPLNAPVQQPSAVSSCPSRGRRSNSTWANVPLGSGRGSRRREPSLELQQTQHDESSQPARSSSLPPEGRLQHDRGRLDEAAVEGDDKSGPADAAAVKELQANVARLMEQNAMLFAELTKLQTGITSGSSPTSSSTKTTASAGSGVGSAESAVQEPRRLEAVSRELPRYNPSDKAVSNERCTEEKIPHRAKAALVQDTPKKKKKVTWNLDAVVHTYRSSSVISRNAHADNEDSADDLEGISSEDDFNEEHSAEGRPGQTPTTPAESSSKAKAAPPNEKSSAEQPGPSNETSPAVGFDGEWSTGEVRAIIIHKMVMFDSGEVHRLEVRSEGCCILYLEEEEFHGQMEPDGMRITWNDGDVWTRAEREYMVENERLEKSSSGVPYRRSKHHDDMLSKVASWGSTISGVDGGDGWLHVGDLFLPMFEDGQQVLVKKEVKEVKALESIEKDGHRSLPEKCTDSDKPGSVARDIMARAGLVRGSSKPINAVEAHTTRAHERHAERSMSKSSSAQRWADHKDILEQPADFEEGGCEPAPETKEFSSKDGASHDAGSKEFASHEESTSKSGLKAGGEQLYKSANMWFAKGDLEAALTDANALAELDPESGEAYNLKARCLLLLDRIPEALLVCKSAPLEARNALESSEWRKFANIAQRIKHHASALDQIQALRTDRAPEKRDLVQKEVEKGLRNVDYMQVRLTRAEQQLPFCNRLRLERVKLLLHPTSDPDFQQRAHIADEEVQLLLRARPNDPDLHCWRARAMLRLGRRHDARSLLEDATRLSGNDYATGEMLLCAMDAAEDHKRQAMQALEKEDYHTAERLYGLAMKVEPPGLDCSFLAWLHLSRATARQKGGYSLHGVLEDIEAALELVPRSAKALFRRGCLHMELELFNEAVADFDAVELIDSTFTGLQEWQTKARAAARLGSAASGETSGAGEVSTSRGTGKDFYQILEVDSNATGEEIKKAYKTAALKWHPDKNPGPNREKAEKKFKDISTAHATLTDPVRRCRYDADHRIEMHSDVPKGSRSKSGGYTPSRGRTAAYGRRY